MSLADNMNITETRIISKIIKNALNNNYRVSICDGEAFPLKRSSSYVDIINAMFSTDEDIMWFRNDKGELVGCVVFVYGNGEDVVHDHTDTEEMRAMVEF